MYHSYLEVAWSMCMSPAECEHFRFGQKDLSDKEMFGRVPYTGVQYGPNRNPCFLNVVSSLPWTSADKDITGAT